MLDRERILAKLDELEGYLSELRQVAPATFEAYKSIEKRRSCERLLQLAIECTIDTSALVVTGLRLGLPAEENDLFEKLEDASIISASLGGALRSMRGMRNVLVHEYGRVDDRLIFDAISHRLGDFDTFKKAILPALPAADAKD